VRRETAFVDTSAWLASLSVREERHEECVAAYDELVRTGTSLLTTNLVVGEVHGLLVRRKGAESGIRLLDLIRGDPAFEVIFVNRRLESSAIDRWLRVHLDKPFSLTDAVSFEVMRERGVRDAFALDHHFEQVGYRLLPKG
jgi:predicted nucleic acid-binding protein